jgi:chromosome segregation ATPase
LIETAMIFALGFLVASLLGLLVLPAVNARAARLARRRAEARLPLSPGEIAAERDFLRAQFAIRERRLERAVEAARAARHADMTAIGAGTMKAAALTRDIVARDAQLAEVRQANGNLEESLTQARADGTTSLATLHALEEAHADLLESLLALRQESPAAGDIAVIAGERDALRASLDAAEQALAALPGHDTAAERENADLRRRITEVAEALVGQARLPRTGTFAPAEPEPERV